MLLQETILCSTLPVAAGSGAGQIAVHDLQTGTVLASFKQSNTPWSGLGVLESKNNQGGFILAAQSDKSILNAYNFQKDQLHLKIVLPEKLTCIAIDRRGDLCAGGTSSGRIYLWEIASGILFSAWDAHYRQISVLRFTNDGAALISGSSDSGVSVWSVSRLLDNETQTEIPSPYCLFSDHTLPVTDVSCGIGAFPNCRILTASDDHTVKLWDLASKTLLTTFQFPQTITRLAWDVSERLFFASSNTGSIYEMNMFQERATRLGMEAIGGAGLTDIIRVGDDENTTIKNKKLISVGQPITALRISLNSTVLLAGTSEGLIHLYDIPSHQLLRTISTHKGFAITHLQTLIRPPDLIGHINLSFSVAGADTKDVLPLKHVAQFHRIKDLKARDVHEVSMVLPSHFAPFHDEGSSYTQDEFLRDHAFFVQPSTTVNGGSSDPMSMKKEISDLQAEVERLREHLGKAKGLNDTMWDTVVQRLVGQDKNGSVEDAEDGPRSKKRGRAT